jgi:hypothetical protein
LLKIQKYKKGPKMKIKSSCKSQFTAIADEVKDMLQQGYSKKALYDYFKSQNKITMSYSSWVVILNYQTEDKPFSIAQKKSIPGATTNRPETFTKSKTVSIDKRGFQHDSTPYASQAGLKPQEKKELQVNLISKEDM